MKGKRTKKLLALFITATMAVMMMGIFASAAGSNNYAAVNGGIMTFKKYFVVPKDTTIPSRTVSYTIEAGAPVDASATTDKVPIYAGPIVDATTPSVSSVSFSSADEIGAKQGTATDGITNNASKKYIEKDVTIDFSGVTFTEPGIYRYIVTEQSVAGASCVGNTKRTVDVYVTDTSGALTVTKVMYMGLVTDQGNPTGAIPNPIATTDGDKCESYINIYPSQNLYIGKKISGNQASKDKYFKFTVTLSGAGNATPIAVAGDFVSTLIPKNVNAATTDLPDAGYTNPSSFNTEADGTKTVVFYLQGGQYVELQGVPAGATYKVIDGDETNGYSSEGYTRTYSSSTNTITIGSLAFSDPNEGNIVDGSDVKVAAENSKNGAIPTGVIISLSGLIVVGIIAVIGFAFFSARSKRRYEEE